MSNRGRRCLTRTAGEHATDTTTNICDRRARIARFRKHLRLAVVVEYRPLHGGPVDGHVIEEVLANDGEDAVRAAEGGASGVSVLDDQQARFAVRVLHVGVVHQVVGEGAHKWKQAIVGGIFEFPISVPAGETFDCEFVGIQIRS